MCRPRGRSALLILGMLCATIPWRPASALDPAKAPTQYVHTKWGTDDGLPQSSVTKILETKDGYLWVGTQAGIARFDGARFTVFDHTNTPSLYDDFISDLAEDRQGTLWIATTHGGATYFKNGLFSHLRSVGSRAALTLAADPDGSMWIGGYGGLTHIDNGKVIRIYTSADGLSGDPIKRLLVGKDGSLWIASAGGLDRMVDDKILSYSTKDGLPSNDVADLYFDANDTLWVRTQNAGLSRWVHDRFIPWKRQGIPGGDIRNVLEDRHGNFWFASAAEGLFRVDGRRTSRFRAIDGLSSDDVACLYEDRRGNLWVGTHGGGLDRFRDGSFTTYSKEEGLATDFSWSLIEDHLGAIWITTAAGLNRVSGNRIHVFTAADGLAGGTTSLWEDHARTLWVATSADGLFQRVGERFAQTLTTRDGTPAYMISGVLEDSQRKLWISTRGGGLARYSNGKVRVYSTADGLSTNSLFAMAEGREGTLWIGTNGGLNSIQGGRIKSYATNKAIADAWVISLYFDSADTLWIGTVGRGLYRFKDGLFRQYSAQQGLPDVTVNSILEDAATNLWIGSNKGIFRISRQDLDAVAAGTKQAVEPLIFGKADGMKGSDTIAGSQPSGWRARDGRLWFPTSRGVVVVDPARLSLNDLPPVARIEEMVADQSPVDLTAPLQLAPGTQRLEIRYTAPNLSAPERMQFRYRLDGFDEQWVKGGAQRLAQYTNLPPGHYTFHVGASAETGRWSLQEATLSFELRPRFHQSWWFRVLYGLAAISLLWGAYRLRVNWLHARAAVLEERQRIAGEIHDSLAQGLSGIVFQTEAALISMKRAPEMTAAHLISARDLAKSSLDEARYSVWDLAPPSLEHKDLAESLSFMARQLAQGRVAELNVHSSGVAWALRPEAKHHLVLIAQEAISNAIQHGNARTISIELAQATSALHLVVWDDGTGFAAGSEAQQPARGYGMRNMRQRAEHLGAKLTVTSDLGQGVRVSLYLPRLGAFARLWRHIRGRSIPRIGI